MVAVYYVFLGVFSSVLAVSNGQGSYGDGAMFNNELFEGDIAGVVNRDDRNALIMHHKLWPGGVVPYEISPELESVRSVIYAAFELFHQHTCIRFIPKGPRDKDYIRLDLFNGCWSHVGVSGGNQSVSLGYGCHNKMIIAHELGHAIGFWHEHSRSDRDQHVDIIWKNIFEGQAHNFVKLNPFENNLLGEDFDYESMMMYESTAWSIDGHSKTIVPKKLGVTLRPVYEKDAVTEIDIRKINKLYECFGTVRPDRPHPPPDACDFESDDCGMESQENMGLTFNRVFATLGGRSGYFLSVVNLENKYTYARLITPYYQAYGRTEACLSFDLLIQGSGLSVAQLIIQSTGTDSVAEFTSTDGIWKNYRFNVKTSPESARFFLTVTFHGESTGSLAMDNFSWTLNACA